MIEVTINDYMFSSYVAIIYDIIYRIVGVFLDIHFGFRYSPCLSKWLFGKY